MLKSSDAVEGRVVFLVTHVFVWVQKVLGKDAGYDLIQDQLDTQIRTQRLLDGPKKGHQLPRGTEALSSASNQGLRFRRLFFPGEGGLQWTGSCWN